MHLKLHFNNRLISKTMNLQQEKQNESKMCPHFDSQILILNTMLYI